jgi:hypothetical protein
VKVSNTLPILFLVAVSTWAQGQGRRLPRYEDYPAVETFSGTPVQPVLTAPEERQFRTVIRQGENKGWGVVDGITGKELAAPGPNFAGRYVIVQWGCGWPCLMVAIVDLRTGRVFPPPFHRGTGHSYFQLPNAFPMDPPLEYRLDSRLIIANICESHEAQKCGAHYFVMRDDGLKLIHRVLEK